MMCAHSLHCMYCGMPKRTSRDEAMLNSKINLAHIALAIIKLRLPEGIGQAGS